ncbi:MAG: hypothetical protein AAF938_04355 [Myxococcota bacterium]
MASSGCDSGGHLRGEARPSRDGYTYLVVADDHGGACGDLIVDGRIWPHRAGTPGRVEPGVHSIDCGSMELFDPQHAIRFEVPEGTVFRFDYWGP